MIKRKCAGCGQIKDRNEMLRLTREKTTGNVIVNPNSKIFGRSAYLCNKNCAEAAIKKNRLQKALKTNISEELKGKLLNES